MTIEAIHSPESVIHSQTNDNGSAALSHKVLSENGINLEPRQQQVTPETGGAADKILTGFSLSDGKDPAPQTAADATFDKKFDEAFLAQLNGDTKVNVPKATDANQEQHKAFMFNMLVNAIEAESQ
jgi:hypothetical protein